MFDADSFLSTTTDGEMSTEFTPVPEGEFRGVAASVTPRQFSSDKGDFTVIDIDWSIDDPSVAELTGMGTSSVRQSIFLDLTESGGLDLGKGKNIQLGRLREALGQNKPGPWSISMIAGNVSTVRVEHRMHEGRAYADVKGVSAA